MTDLIASPSVHDSFAFDGEEFEPVQFHPPWRGLPHAVCGQRLRPKVTGSPKARSGGGFVLLLVVIALAVGASMYVRAHAANPQTVAAKYLTGKRSGVQATGRSPVHVNRR